MLKFASLAQDFIKFIRNGVMSHVACVTALRHIYLMKPTLKAKITEPTTFTLELSKGLRTLLCWFQELAKGNKLCVLNLATASDKVGDFGLRRPTPKQQSPNLIFCIVGFFL